MGNTLRREHYNVSADGEDGQELHVVIKNPRDSEADGENSSTRGSVRRRRTATVTSRGGDLQVDGPPPPPSDLVEVITNSKMTCEMKEWKKWLKKNRRQAKVILQRPDLKGWAPLHHAAHFGCREILEIAKKCGVDMELKTEKEGMTPLLVAAKHIQKDTVLWLIQDANAKGSAVDKHGRNVIHLTVSNQDETMEYSLETFVRQFRPNCRMGDNEGNTPLHIACREGNEKAIEFMLDIEEEEEEEQEEDEKKEEEEVEEEHEQGGKEEDEGEEQQQRREGDSVVSEKIKKLLTKRNKCGETPVHMAAMMGHTGIVANLLSKDDSLRKEEDDDKNWPLHFACKSGHLKTVEEILNHAHALLADGSRFNSARESPFHCAAHSNNAALMEYLVNVCTHKTGIDVKDELNSKNSHNHTPLMIACIRGNADVVKVLLMYGASVSLVDERSYNALDLAIEKGRWECASHIVESDVWKEALKNSSGSVTPFRRMIKKMPDLAYRVLTRCVKPKGKIKDEQFKVEVDFEFIEDMQEFRKSHSVELGVRTVGEVLVAPADAAPPTTKKKLRRRWPLRKYKKENHILAIMVQSKQVELLQHPLVATLLNRKWAKFGALMYILSLLLFVGLVIFITSFALAVPHPLSEACKDRNSTTRECGDTSRAGLFFTAVVTVIMCGISLLWWLLRFIQPYQKDRARGGHHWSMYINWKYWRDWRTYINLEVPLLIFTLLFVSVFHEDCLCPARWQWRVGIVAVFLAWVRLFFVLHQFPTIGVYAGMMLTIVVEFLKVFVMATLLVVSFGITFYMAFYEPDIPASPFRTPWTSIVSIVVYMAGGPDSGLFRLDNEGSGDFDDVPFPVVSYAFWIIFIVIMSILFINFLTGLAVGDVQDVRNSANLQRLSKKVEFVLNLEQKYIPFRTHNLTKSIHPKLSIFSTGWKDHLQNFWRWKYLKSYWRKFIWSFTKEEDLTNITTTEALLYPEEKQTETDKVRIIVQAIAEKNDEREENLKQVLTKLSEQESEISDKFEEQEKTIRAVLSKLDDQEKLLKEILQKLPSRT